MAFDSFEKAIPRYHHPDYYPFNSTGVGSTLTPQINNITFVVRLTLHLKFTQIYIHPLPNYRNHTLLYILILETSFSAFISICR